jgi:hypothetical protein
MYPHSVIVWVQSCSAGEVEGINRPKSVHHWC